MEPTGRRFAPPRWLHPGYFLSPADMTHAPAKWWCTFRALDSLCFLPSPDGLVQPAADSPSPQGEWIRKAGQDLSVVGTARKTGYACRRVRKLSARIF